MTRKILLFLDESGKPDLDDSTYRHFLLTGVVIPETEMPVVSGYFSYIKRKYSLPLDHPFHTYDLLENSHTKFTPENARNFVISMSEFIEACPIGVFLVDTDKKKFLVKYRKELERTKITIRPENKGTLYFLSAYKQFQLFADYLIRQKGTGSIYADSRYNQDRDILDAFLKIRDLQLKGGVVNPYGEKTRAALTSVTFASKLSLSAGLELTDFISFVAFAKAQRTLRQFSDMKLYKSLAALEMKLVGGKIYAINPKLVRQFSQ